MDITIIVDCINVMIFIIYINKLLIYLFMLQNILKCIITRIIGYLGIYNL